MRKFTILTLTLALCTSSFAGILDEFKDDTKTIPQLWNQKHAEHKVATQKADAILFKTRSTEHVSKDQVATRDQFKTIAKAIITSSLYDNRIGKAFTPSVVPQDASQAFKTHVGIVDAISQLTYTYMNAFGSYNTVAETLGMNWLAKDLTKWIQAQDKAYKAPQKSTSPVKAASPKFTDKQLDEYYKGDYKGLGIKINRKELDVKDAPLAFETALKKDHDGYDNMTRMIASKKYSTILTDDQVQSVFSKLEEMDKENKDAYFTRSVLNRIFDLAERDEDREDNEKMGMGYLSFSRFQRALQHAVEKENKPVAEMILSYAKIGAERKALTENQLTQLEDLAAKLKIEQPQSQAPNFTDEKLDEYYKGDYKDLEIKLIRQELDVKDAPLAFETALKKDHDGYDNMARMIASKKYSTILTDDQVQIVFSKLEEMDSKARRPHFTQWFLMRLLDLTRNDEDREDNEKRGMGYLSFSRLQRALQHAVEKENTPVAEIILEYAKIGAKKKALTEEQLKQLQDMLKGEQSNKKQKTK